MSHPPLPPATPAERDLAGAASDTLDRLITAWAGRLAPRQRQILATAQSLAELLAAKPDPTVRCRCIEIRQPHYVGDHDGS